ncbi:MAG: MerR family transcriptional regulator [Saprospiraceae bacterium]|nr:MerR family transcriptional regulator [Saprospiraceae bacterium]
MAIYSIRDLEKLSGIKAHTIRIWEKRYGLLQPQRTETNIRYYQDDDVKLLLNTALLNRHGYKISKIASMSQSEINEAILRISESEFDTEVQSDALTLAMLEMDEERFQATINKRIKELGFKETIMQVFFPFLNRLSVLWMTGSVLPVQENYIAGLIKQKLYVAIDAITLPQKETPSFLLYLPEGEEQELSLLFIHYLLKEQGFKVFNLGRNISLEDLKNAYKIQEPDFIFSIINDGLFKMSLKDYVDEISLHCRNSEILLTGIQVNRKPLKTKDNCHTFDGFESIMAYLEKVKV